MLSNLRLKIGAVIGVIALIGITACKKEEKEIGTPISKIEGITGTWKVNGVVQRDEQSPVKDELDLTQFFVGGVTEPLELSFDGSDFTYKVDAFGGKNPFGDAGTWQFDDVNYPTFVTLFSITNDTTKLKLGRTIRPTDQILLLDQQRLCGDEPIITYQYTFNRQ